MKKNEVLRKDDRRRYYIVQFNEPPFLGESEYIIVPRAWIQSCIKDLEVMVEYPCTSNPYQVRYLAKNRIHNDDGRWWVFKGTIVYKTNSYKDAEIRFANKNFSSNDEQNAKSKSALNKKLRGAKKEKPKSATNRFKNPRKPLPRISIRLKEQPLPPPKRDFNLKLSNPDLRYISKMYGSRWEAAQAKNAATCSSNVSSVLYAQSSQSVDNTTSTKSNLEEEQTTMTKSMDKEELLVLESTSKPLLGMPKIYLTQSETISQDHSNSSDTEEQNRYGTPINISEYERHPVFRRSIPMPKCKLLQQVMTDVRSGQDIGKSRDIRLDTMDGVKEASKPCQEKVAHVSISTELTHAVQGLHDHGMMNTVPVFNNLTASQVENVSTALQSSTAVRPVSTVVQHHSQNVLPDSVIRFAPRNIFQGLALDLDIQQRNPRSSNNFDPRLFQNKADKLEYDSRSFIEQSHDQNFPINMNEANIFNTILNNSHLQNSQNSTIVQPNQFMSQQENQNLFFYNIYCQPQQLLNHTGQHLLKETDQRSTVADTDHTPKIIQNITIRGPNTSTTQCCSHILNLSNDSKSVQMLQNQQPSQYNLRATSNQVGTSISSNNRSQKFHLQGITTKTETTQQFIPPNDCDKMRMSINGQRNSTNDPRAPVRFSKMLIEHDNIMDRSTVLTNTISESSSDTQNFQDQPTSSQKLHKKQFMSNSNNQKHQPIVESTSKLRNKQSRVKRYIRLEEQLSPNLEIASNPEVVENDQIVSKQDQQILMDDEIFTDSPPVEVVNDVASSRNTTVLQSYKKSNLTATQISKISNKKLHPRIIAEYQMLSEMAVLIDQFQEISCSMVKLFHKTNNSFIQSSQTYSRLLDAGMAFREKQRVERRNTSQISPFNRVVSASDSLNPTTSSSNVAVAKEVSKITDQRSTQQSEEQASNDGHESSHNVKIVLPPEYDPNDTKWTLKYREPNPQLLELKPDTGIYVNRLKLAHFKRISTDSKALARNLLTEVFSQNALAVCSLTGAKPNAFRNASVRPGLDEHARLVMMAYVYDHARKKGWPTGDNQHVINSIRSKVQEIRRKHRQAQTK